MLVAEVGLVGDFIGVELIVTVGVQSRLHQVACVLAIGSGRGREELEEVAYSRTVDYDVAEVVCPGNLIAVEVSVEIAVPTPLQNSPITSATTGYTCAVAVVVDMLPAGRVLVRAIEIHCDSTLVEGADV